MPGSSGQLLLRPRTLAKTSIVRRTIVEVTGTGAAKLRDEELATPETLSADTYWEPLEANVPGARAALENLIQNVEPLGVYPDFLKSLIFRWDQPGSRPVNLGYIMPKYGTIWTDLSSTNVSHELADSYVKNIAAAFGCEVHALPSGNSTLYKHGKPLRLASVKDHLDAWIEPMRRFIAAISEHNGATG